MADQDRPPNFRKNGQLFLIRCFECEPKRGRENWGMSVAAGVCAWCGWSDKDQLKQEQDNEGGN